MSLIQHDYELSIWKDVWAKPTLLDEKGNVTGEILNGEEILDEEKSAVLATDEMTFPGKAINIVFKTKLNGTHDLTFDLPSKYVDPNTGKKVKNYLRSLIDNETKVKLFYRDKWYSFYVKKVSEKRDKNYTAFSYSCEDSYITELSKIGYKLTFDENTKHYVEPIHSFSRDILEGSEWQYNEQKTRDNCDLREYKEEKLIRYITNTQVTLHLLTSSAPGVNEGEALYYHHLYGYNSNSDIIVPSGTIVYGFYSEYNQDVKDKDGHLVKQVIYVPDINEPGDGYFISGNTIDNKNCNYIVSAEALSVDSDHLYHEDNRYGLKIEYNEYTEFSEELKRYVKRYTPVGTGTSWDLNTSDDYYSFTKTHIMVPAIAQNCVANSKDMTNTTGWAPYRATDKIIVGKIKEGTWWKDENGIPSLDYSDYFGQNVNNGAGTDDNGNNLFNNPPINTYAIVTSSFSGVNNAIVNSGPYSKKIKIDTPTTFAFRIDYTWAYKEIDNGDYTSTISEPIYKTAAGEYSPITIELCRPFVSNIDSYYKSIVTEASALDDDGNYNLNQFKTITDTNGVQSGQYYLVEITNADLANGPITDIFIKVNFNGLIKDRYFCISNMEFFEAWTYDGRHTKPRNNNRTVDINDIVPAYLEEVNYGWLQDYILKLQTGSYVKEGTGEVSVTLGSNNSLSASNIYNTMMDTLNRWKENRDLQYSLVTENSMVTGESFLEEIYFKVIPRQYSTPYGTNKEINYLKPTEELEQWYNCEKYRTLKQSKSNRFNLSQEISKLFHVYPIYEIEYYPNGKVKRDLYDEDGNIITANSNASVSYSRRHKWLYYVDSKGGINKYGFKYGHNLSSISRTIDSTNIVTKMFVLDNMSTYAKDGICTIARASDNIGKDTYLFRFDYLIDRGIVSREKIEKDLYSKDIKSVIWNTWINFLHADNDSARKYSEDLKNYSGYNFTSPTIYKGLLPTIGEINVRYDKLAYDQALLEKYQLVVLEASVKTYKSAVASLREQLAKQKQLADAYVQEKTNKKAIEYRESCERIATKLATYEIYLNAAQCMYEVYADLYNKYKCEMNFLLYCKKRVEDNFNRRYESLIKEGVWQDSKYLNDNAYYIDAEKVLADSCGPKISYNLSVTDLSVLDKYKFTDFSIGDITYVEDYEFFEDNLEDTKKFYLEKTIVSSITCNLDNPSKNSITLQNYTTKFDDLFSRITASVQSLTFNENIYQRAAKFTTNGQVDPDTIQETLANNNLTIVGTQEVTIDHNGILVTDLRIPSNKVKIVGGGVYITGDGGASWSGALENGGINASALKVGSIDTKSISIYNDDHTSFIWDKDGITAYGTTSVNSSSGGTKDKITSNSYVRFNHNGLYFVDNSAADFDEGLAKSKSEKNADYIMENAAVALTSRGFSIQSTVQSYEDEKDKAEIKRSIKFTSDDGIIMTVNGETVLQLGYICGLNEKGIKDFWGLRAQGAYIEGTLVSEYIGTRKLISNGNEVEMLDVSSTKLRGGRLEISRSLVDTSTEVATLKPEKITTFGTSTLQKSSQSSSQNNEQEPSSGSGSNQGNSGTDDTEQTEEQGVQGTQETLIGSSIRLHDDCSYWCITQKEEDTKWHMKLVYAKEELNNTPGGTFKVNCDMITRNNSGQSSDVRLKKNIKELDNRYIQLFDNLKPKTFNFKDEINTPLHIGLIAQEVEAAMDKAGLTRQDLGAIIDIGGGMLGLRYTELLTIAIAKIKQLEEEIKKLKNK